MSEESSQQADSPATAAASEGQYGNLVPSLVLSGLLALGGIVAWGFPGLWVLTALIPGFILGSTGAHIFRATRKIHAIRPGVVALGIFLGGVGAFVSLAINAAATAPVEQRIEQRVTIEAPLELVWDRVKRADQRVAWSILVNEAEPIGRGGSEDVGSRYRVTLNIDGAPMSGEHEIVSHEELKQVGWKVKFPQGVRIENFGEQVALSERGGNTLVTYAITYRVPSVMGRLFNNFRVRSMFEEAAKLSMSALVQKSTE